MSGGHYAKNFLEEKTAIMWHSTGNLTAVKKVQNLISVSPCFQQETPGTPTGGGNFYIFKKASDEERAASLKLIRFMTDPERSASWSVATGYMGISPDSYETDKLKSYVKDFPPAAVARDQLEFATAELATYQAGRIKSLMMQFKQP